MSAHGDSEPPNPLDAHPQTFTQKIKRAVVGGPRNVEDPSVFHSVSLVAFLAWVGLGADGLSSSSYGPEEAFKALGDQTYLAVGLALATAFTVFIISYAYRHIIEQFPFGGGGYVVASKLLGPKAGLVSGSALIIDYVLTITISVAAGADAVFSFLPADLHGAKLPVEFTVLGLLMLMNMRGIKESVKILTPVFIVFLITHAALIAGVIGSHVSEFPTMATEFKTGYHHGLSTLGAGGMLLLFMRAYSMGGGTYTGIEAVSNGLMIMREPKVATGKRTMLLMAVSLAITAGGIILAYLLMHVSPVDGKTMNAVLAERFADRFTLGHFPAGHWFVQITLVSEALLLFVAAQAGFIDGPRVMANMATNSFLPHRFSQLSDRLTMQNGVFLMGGASLAALIYTRGNVSHLVVMYSINVFVTFSLSQLAMCRFWIRHREKHGNWKWNLVIHGVGFVLCAGILGVTIFEKFAEGGWVTMALTGTLVALCLMIRRHYRRVQENLKRLDEVLRAVPAVGISVDKAIAPNAPTAVLMVGAYAGLGVHSLLTIQRLFPNYYKNFIFLSVGVVDAATFKDLDEVEEVRSRTENSLIRYVELSQRLGLAADFRMSVGTEAVAEAEKLCEKVGKEFPRAMFFAGKLIFEQERWFQRLLHNETDYALQRRLQFVGLNAMVLPVRVLESAHA